MPKALDREGIRPGTKDAIQTAVSTGEFTCDKCGETYDREKKYEGVNVSMTVIQKLDGSIEKVCSFCKNA